MKAELTSADLPLDLSGLVLAVTEHAPLPMATVEGATHIVRYVNPAFCRLMGARLEQLVGKPFDELLPDKDHCVTLLERVFLTGKPESHTEEEHFRPHPVFWSYTMWPVLAAEHLVGVMIQVTETAQFHGKTLAMNQALTLGSVRLLELAEAAENLNEKLRAEIAERQRAEEALRESEERFRSLFASAPMAVFSCDQDGVIQFYNRRAVELWGREPERGVESHCGSLRLWLPDGTLLPHDRSPMVEVLRTGASALNVEVSIERPDGSRLPVLVNFAALKNAQGEITGAITSFLDITERRVLEDSLVERASDLVRADRSKDEFLAMLAHELRNPLAPLRNAAEILRTVGASPEACEQAQMILPRQIENMTRMIDDLLDVSRITEGKIDLRPQPVALADILAGAASVAQSGITARRQNLVITPPAQPVFLHADATRLEQVFGNLLANASKYSDSGGRISVSAEVPSDARSSSPGSGVRARSLPDEDDAGEKEPWRPEVIVRVRDDGIGIAPELLPQIFGLFVQAAGALDRSHGGLGIGLTLVQRLVQLHGGSVEAHSAGLGHGSEFVVRLPILPHPALASPPPLSAPVRERTRRMLIVDDNEDSAGSMSTLQRLRGHETRTAFTGLDAVAAAAEFLPEVVLLDIGLPGMDGFEVARRLRAMPVLERIFLVAMTGYGSEEHRAAAHLAGFDEYFVKPVDLERLRACLRGWE